MTNFEKAYEQVQLLVQKFEGNLAHYMSPSYQETEARKDFIDKFFIALGWDVNHDTQHNPYEQDVKIEHSQKQQNESAKKRADYAFYKAPNFKDVHFFVEAKKPAVLIQNNPFHYFQTIKYGWNATCPISVLTDFEEFVIVDCRHKPNLKYALNGAHQKFRFTDYKDKEQFAKIYFLLSKEAIQNNSIENYVATLPKAKGKAIQKTLFPGAYKEIDEDFLIYIDGIRENLAKAFKKNDDTLDSEALTEATQRTVDRLVFIRFLEDKLIEPHNHISEYGLQGKNVWKDFVSDCRALDAKYNGVVFKKHFIDEQNFVGADEKLFADICADISNVNSPYHFNYIPIHILGSIYERFLGKVVVATDKRVRIEEKPEVRKAGGVYYTPKYIVDYIVENTVGKLIADKKPNEIAELHFADIACGSGSFLIGVYDCLLKYHTEYYQKNTAQAKKDGCELRDGQYVLTLKQKQDILLNNIYGVDIDYQAVEVTQLSLFLKMLEDETVSTTQKTQSSLFLKVLPDLSNNIKFGNSLIGTDILHGQLFSDDEYKKLNPFDYKTAFPKVFKKGGFDAIVGNPPYLSTKGINKIEKKYFLENYKSASGQFDLYGLFIEKCYNALKSNGIQGYITSNTLLSNKDFINLRKLLLENTSIIEIVNLGETVFKDANLDVSIIIWSKYLSNNNHIKIVKNDIDFKNGISHETNQNLFLIEETNYEIQIGIQEVDFRILKTIFNNKIELSNFLNLPRGIEFGSNSDKIIQQKKSGYDKLLVGKNIKKYSTEFNEMYVQFENNKSVFKEIEIYNQNKILIQRIRNLSLKTRIVATIDYEKHLCTNTLRIGIKKNKDDKLEFFLGILNSKLVNYIFLKMFFNKDIYAYQLERIPIPSLDLSNKEDKAKHDKLVQLVELMLQAKQHLQTPKTERDKTLLEQKCTNLDKQIDDVVYELYGITEEEQQIIESN